MSKINMEKIGGTFEVISIGINVVGGVLDLLDKEISLPTVPGKTMGGEKLWRTLRECNGWRLQQNKVTHHARIIDDKNIRTYCGTVNGMYRAWDRLAEMGFA